MALADTTYFEQALTEDQDKHLATLSERLSYALKYTKVSQSELARRIGIKQQAIQYLCASNATKSKFTYEIADALDIRSDWLAQGKGSMLEQSDPTRELAEKQVRIPVLTKEALLPSHHKQKEFPQQWVLVEQHYSEGAFAIEVYDKSMFPLFDQETLIILDPNKEPVDQSFCLVFITSCHDIVFRKLIKSEDATILQPINTEFYNPVPLRSDDIILGTMCEAKWKN